VLADHTRLALQFNEAMDVAIQAIFEASRT
jgi:hypothetical protein